MEQKVNAPWNLFGKSSGMNGSKYLKQRYDTIENKIKSLSKLRDILGLEKHNDIEESQWDAIESQLFLAQSKFLSRLKKLSSELFRNVNDMQSLRSLNEQLGKVELDLSRSFSFYDTFLDILSQRLLPGIGPILKGCDVLANDSIRKNHPALSTLTKPIVYFDRGFGASTRREGVWLYSGSKNPITTIQIPYTKIKTKYDLTSIVHEAGHSIMVRLGLERELSKEIRESLALAGASELMQNGFASWSKEIGPDFWGFLNCGIAQALATRELLSLPQKEVFSISFNDPHPPPFLRVLIVLDWCRRQWGAGEWDEWESEWRYLYPLTMASEMNRKILKEGEKFIHVVSRVLFRTRFKNLGFKTIPSLFNMEDVSPNHFRRILSEAKYSGILNLADLSPCGQLGFFGYLRANSKISEETLDRLMTRWLIQFGKRKLFLN